MKQALYPQATTVTAGFDFTLIILFFTAWKILRYLMFCKKSKRLVFSFVYFTPREGVIIECPLNDLFHDVVTVILTSRMGVSEMVVNVGNRKNNDNDDEKSLVSWKMTMTMTTKR